MKRILQIVGSLNRGGLETVAVNCMKYANHKVYQFDFLVYGDEIGEMEQEVIQYGCRVIHIPSPKKNYMYSYKEFKRVLLEYGSYDIVHAHTYFNSAIPIMIAKKNGVPCCIAHAHSIKREGDDKLRKRLAYFILRKMFYKYSDKFCACSEEAGNWVFGKNMFLRKGMILPNVIDIERFAYNIEKRKEIRSELKIEDEFVIGCVGRLVKGKNIKHLIDVFFVYRQEKESILLIVGDGPLRQELEEYAKDLGILNNICFVGKRTDIPNLLSAMDIFVMPSKHEGLGIVLIEAMANGLCCVVNKSAIVQVIAKLETCKTVDNWSCEKWVERINQVRYQLNDKRICPYIIEKEYSIKNFKSGIIRLYDRGVK